MNEVEMNLAMLKLVQKSGICINRLGNILDELNDRSRHTTGDMVLFTKDEINILSDSLCWIIRKLSFED